MRKPSTKDLEERIQKLESSIPKKSLRAFSIVIKIVGAIGSLGAFISIFFLWCNLREMQKQTELENRGFFDMALDSFQFRPDTLKLIVYYRFYEASRIPVTVKGPLLTLVSSVREISFPGFIEENEAKMRGQYMPKSPIAYGADVLQEMGLPDSISNEIVTRVNKKDRAFNCELYFHAIFKYEDITKKEYWVYKCWELETKFTPANGGINALSQISYNNYVIWEAKPGETFPDTMNLPEELKEITKKARGK